MAEIVSIYKDNKMVMFLIKKGPYYHYFKGEKMIIIRNWITSGDIKIKWFINSLR